MIQHLYTLESDNKMKSKYIDLKKKFKLSEEIRIIRGSLYNYKQLLLRMNSIRTNNNKPLLKKDELFPKDGDYKLNIIEDNLDNYGSISSSLWNLDSKQDYVWCKDNNLLLVDGHGTDVLINWIRDLKDETLIVAFADDSNPIEFLEDRLKSSFINTKRTGACVTAIKIREHKIDIYKVGDAGARVYVNKELIVETDDHSAQNRSEYLRKEKEGAKFEEILALYNLPPSPDGKINISKREAHYIHHSLEDVCMLSRTMGHADKGKDSNTGKMIEHKTVNFGSEDEVLVIACSDGVWDMVHKEEDISGYRDASSIVLEACRRWHSNINFVHWEGHDCKMCRAKRANKDSTSVVTDQMGMLPDDISSIVWYKGHLERS